MLAAKVSGNALSDGLEKISDETLWKILADADLAEFVRSLPKGLDTPLRERGAQLSGGPRQRLATARALVRNLRLVILDEATSALDTESERLVQEALARLTPGRTPLIVAHGFPPSATPNASSFCRKEKSWSRGHRRS